MREEPVTSLPVTSVGHSVNTMRAVLPSLVNKTCTCHLLIATSTVGTNSVRQNQRIWFHGGRNVQKVRLLKDLRRNALTFKLNSSPCFGERHNICFRKKM